MAIAKEILDMLDIGQKAIASNFSCFFTSKLQKSHRIGVPTVQWLLIIPFDGYRWPHRKESLICGYTPLRGEPTESIDGNYHRNKTIKFWSNGITCLYRKYMVYPLKESFSIENAFLFV